MEWDAVVEIPAFVMDVARPRPRPKFRDKRSVQPNYFSSDER
jgi:hypothetical protein